MGAGLRVSAQLGAIGMAPIAAAAIVAPAAAAPLAVTIGEAGDGARVQLRWDDGRITAPDVETSVTQGALLVKFAEPFDLDLANVANSAPGAIGAISADDDRR